MSVSFDSNRGRYDAICLAAIGSIGVFTVTGAYSDPQPGWGPSSGSATVVTNGG